STRSPGGWGVVSAARGASLGAAARAVSGIAELERALADAKKERRTTVIAIATDPAASTAEGGAWWDVAVPEISRRPQVTAAREAYEAAMPRQRTSGYGGAP